MGSSIWEVIGHYQNSIENSLRDEPRLLHCINKLDNLPIKLEHLQKTRIARAVQYLQKYESDVGVAAKSLFAKWEAVNNNDKNIERSSSSQIQKYSKSSKSSCDDIKEYRSRTHERKEIRSHQNGQKINSIDHKTDEKNVHKSHNSTRKENVVFNHKGSRSDSKDKKRKTSNHSSDYVKDDLTNGTDTKVRDNKRKRESSRSRSPVKRKIPKLELVHEIDSSMGISFEDALGSFPKPGKSKSSFKRISKVNLIKAKPKTALLLAPLLASKGQLELLDPSLVSDWLSSSKCQPQQMTDEEVFQAATTSKTMRTKVYSGVRNGAVYPSSFDVHIQDLYKNFDGIEYTGGVPYEILKPVLERVTPLQLLNFEEYNSYIIEDTDILWKQHCRRHYPDKQRLEIESWREMFARCKEEQNHRLSTITENIKQSQNLPKRKTLLVIDSDVKPPRNVIRKQQQNGTQNIPITPLGVKQAIAETSQANRFIHPKKAPIMQKSLNQLLMKAKYRR